MEHAHEHLEAELTGQGHSHDNGDVPHNEHEEDGSPIPATKPTGMVRVAAPVLAKILTQPTAPAPFFAGIAQANLHQHLVGFLNFKEHIPPPCIPLRGILCLSDLIKPEFPLTGRNCDCVTCLAMSVPNSGSWIGRDASTQDSMVILPSGRMRDCRSAPGMDRASQHLEHAIGTETLYRPDDNAVIEQQVAHLTAGGLTADEAVQVALLNNPRLQAAVYRLGISRADFVQSGLFTNPSLSFSLRWPDGGGLTNLQAGIAQNVAELWQIKHRKEAAERDLDRTILDVAREASMLALDARVAYWRAVRADRESDLARENLALGQKLIDVAISRREAGRKRRGCQPGPVAASILIQATTPLAH
jgi:hypothetical protein